MFRKESINTRTLSVCIAFLFLATSFPSLLFASSGEFEINCPYWYILFDRAGYVDITEWYPSERHSYGPHEMMTGDLAAACWYSGINGSNEAEWLTDYFYYPSFSTGSPFDFVTYQVQNDSNNPVWTDPCQPTEYIPGTGTYSISSTGNDSGWSKIDDDKLQVTIHYEVVDLGENIGSPLAFRDANGTPTYVLSERYVLLQTYVFENIHETEHIYGLEFYQLLHGHPANAYSNLIGSYETTTYSDPLSSYTPYDSNHTVGNFRYDITMWNDYTGDPNGQHVDWMSFSSTIAPNDVGLGEFSDYSKPTTGPYVDVINRNLNGQTTYDNDNLAGAMMWYLDDDLAPGETTSITLALMYGTAWEAAQTTPVKLSKDDDVDSCVWPYIEGTDIGVINYTIHYDMNTWSDPCVYIVDELPDEVDFNSCTGGGKYDDVNHTVTWSLGALDANETGSVSLTVHVNYQAEPGGDIVNNCIMYGDTFVKSAGVNTCVECWAGTILYVDANAPVDGNGMSWATAYNDLQDALDKVSKDDCLTTIWVAAGTYKPVNDVSVQNWQDYSFELFNGLGLIGHFEGNETDPSQRKLNDPNFATVLTGQIDEGSNVYYIVTGNSVSNILIDGFTIGSAPYGIELDGDSNATILNCTIKNCTNTALPLPNATVQMHNCNIKDNSMGIYIDDSSVNISNSIFNNNSSRQIKADDSSSCLYLTNCAFDGSGSCYLGLETTDGEVTAVGCSFTGHEGYSIVFSGQSLYMADCNCDESCDESAVYIGTDASALVENCFIKNTKKRGIDASSCNSLTVTKSSITDCASYGIKFSNSGDLVVTDCTIKGNGYTGIHAGESTNDTVNALVERCLIIDNDEYWGINFDSIEHTQIVRNNWICRNKYGVRVNGDSVATIQNNTIAFNTKYGVRNYDIEPNVTSCIIWNDEDDLYNCSATYSCIKDCDDAGGEGNICGDANNPCFVDADSNNFHLLLDSPCKDSGTGDYTNETDIDDEPRTANDSTDMGADEYYWPKADYNQDEIVNFRDYALFAEVWLNDNEPSISLDDDNDVDIDDLDLFSFDWLWESAWGEGFMMCMGGGGFGGGMMFMPEALLVSRVAQSVTSNSLMIPDVSASRAAMPDSVYAKAEKFYAINAYNNVHAIRQAPKDFPETGIQDLVDWLDEIWESGELKESMTETEYLEFRKALLNGN